jgi:serine/threonine protein kinase
MLTFECAACQQKLQIRPEDGGKQVKCRKCGHIMVAPPAPMPVASLAQNLPTQTLAPSPPAPPASQRAGTVDLKQAGTNAAANSGEHDSSLTNFLAPAQVADELGRLGKYRVLSIIGRGGMGVVYRAEDSLLKRVVALKAILPSLGANAAVHKRFLREARAMAAVDNGHIVRLYEVNEDGGVPYIAMEFLHGESLADRLSSTARMPLPEILRIGREIAQGLAAAHARGLIHRDIKPANIWLESVAQKIQPLGPVSLTNDHGPRTRDFRVKILDFGLARAAEEDTHITQSGTILGTPSYMSPEQSRGEKVDFRSDLFSLGVVLYRLCTDSEPFTGPDGVSTMLAIATATPTPPQMRNLDVPAELSDLIMQLLEKDPARRTSTAQVVAETLASIERGEPVAVVRNEGNPVLPVATVAPPATARRKVPVWLVIVAAISLVGACLTIAAIGAAVLWTREWFG